MSALTKVIFGALAVKAYRFDSRVPFRSLSSLFHSYALTTGKLDRERLTILNEIHNPFTISRLDVKQGDQVLTIGCGIGLLERELAEKLGPLGSILATDINADQLAIAEQNAADSKNIQFKQLDVENADQISSRFDCVHCRFVLSHMPFEKVEQVIPILYNLLSPGGTLVLEEIANLSSYECDPPNVGYNKWIGLVLKQFAAQKSDSSPGERIVGFLKKKGYSVSACCYQPLLSTKREKKILSLGVKSVEDRLVKEGSASSAEIKETVTLLEQLEQDESALPRYNLVQQIIVRRPV